MGWDRTDGVYIFALALLRGVEMGRWKWVEMGWGCVVGECGMGGMGSVVWHRWAIQVFCLSVVGWGEV